MTTLSRILSRLGWIAFMVLISTPAFAQDEAKPAKAEWGSTLAEVLLLLIVSACLLTLVRVYFSVRGGRIAQGWFWFVIGFSVLGLAQVVLFAGRIGIFDSPDFWVASIRIVAMIVFFIGATRMKRLLT